VRGRGPHLGSLVEEVAVLENSLEFLEIQTPFLVRGGWRELVLNNWSIHGISRSSPQHQACMSSICVRQTRNATGQPHFN